MLRGIYAKGGETNVVKATGNGMILDLPIKEGGSVMARGTFNEGSTIARLADMSSLFFKGNVPEIDMMKLIEGMDLNFTMSANENLTFKGKIEKIAPKGFFQDGVCRFFVYASINIPESERRLIRAGCTANAVAVVEKKTKVYALEEKYVQYSHDSVFVEVLTENGKYQKRLLKTGISDGYFVEIIDGLTLRDKIKKNIQTVR